MTGLPGAAAEEVRRAYDALVAQGEAAQFSSAWLDVLFAAGQRVEFRPAVSEAVAPHVHPETPPTRDRTPEEARDALQRDWPHQAAEPPRPRTC